MNPHKRRQQRTKQERIRQVMAGLAEGKTDIQMAEEIGCHKNSILNYKKGIPPVTEARQDQLARIAGMWQKIESDDSMTSAEKHLAFARWMKLEIDLTGTAAASKSVVAHVTQNTAVQYRFLERSHGLSVEQIEEVFRFMDSLPRQRVSIADCFPEQQATKLLECGPENPDVVEEKDLCS